ncbi:MAG: acyl carrier protein [Candidatus Eremiobacteraeota bacterium]|nr:acyl carrier protein [Candidatus Eremiobacteraeota bacterium]MBV8723557.1 acyl carrier protein [Candidatus Eremiobacteraeota bacterium]
MQGNAAPSDRLAHIVTDVLRVPRDGIADDLDMETTSTWDSLSHMELIAAIEDEFGVALTADEIVSMRSLGAIKGVLRAKSIAL